MKGSLVSKTQIALLPGLHGTTKLFGRFIAAAPNVSITAIPLTQEPLTYVELADRLAGALPDGKPVLIAESFSGPLALALAERHPVAAVGVLQQLVVAPSHRRLRLATLAVLFKLPMPHFLLRRYMLGSAVDDTLVREVRRRSRPYLRSCWPPE